MAITRTVAFKNEGNKVWSLGCTDATVGGVPKGVAQVWSEMATDERLRFSKNPSKVNVIHC